jgi:hypothetical protein
MPPLREDLVRDRYHTRPSASAAREGPQQPPVPPDFFTPMLGQPLILIGWFTSGCQYYWVLEWRGADGRRVRYFANITCSF